MSCSKPLPPFVCDLLYYLNRDQLERFSIVCRPLKNFIERYFHSKPCRIFDKLEIRGGSYALILNALQWHPNRDDYSPQQFLADRKKKDGVVIFRAMVDYDYYSFAEMRQYLGPTIRIEETTLYVAGDSTYSPEHIEQMESIVYLWRDYNIRIFTSELDHSLICAEDFQPILNSPTILQCRELYMINGQFSFKDYKVLYAVKVVKMAYAMAYFDGELDPSNWTQFFEQPGVKPIVVLQGIDRANIAILLDQLSKAFSSAILPNAFKVVLVQPDDEPLTEYRETNNHSGEILELKKGLPIEYQKLKNYRNNYTLERSSV